MNTQQLPTRFGRTSRPLLHRRPATGRLPTKGACLVFLLATIATARDAPAGTWEIEIIAEEAVTTAPNSPAVVQSLGVPVMHSGRVLFGATPFVGYDEVWSWEDGQLSVVAGGPPSYSGNDTWGEVATFRSSAGAIEARTGTGGIDTIADGATPLPEGGGTFSAFRVPTTDGTTVLFAANGSPTGTPQGIYARDVAGGPISRLLHLDDGFSQLARYWLHADDSEVVFRAVPTGGTTTIYRMDTDGANLEVVVDENTPVPGTMSTFDPLSLDNNPASISQGSVLVTGYGGSVKGLFLKRGDQALVPVVTNSTVPPGSTDPFQNFFAIALSGENVAFRGSGFAGTDVRPGLYAVVDGVLDAVLVEGDLVDGRPWDWGNMGLSARGMDGASIAVWGRFTDNSRVAVLLLRCTDCSFFADGFEIGDTRRWSAAVP